MNTQKNKGGRPPLPKGVKKTKHYTVNLNPLEAVIVRSKAKEAGMTATEFIAKSALQITIKALATPEECELLRLVANFTNNTNQLAHCAHLIGYDEAAKMYSNTVRFYSELQHRIQTR